MLVQFKIPVSYLRSLSGAEIYFAIQKHKNFFLFAPPLLHFYALWCIIAKTY